MNILSDDEMNNSRKIELYFLLIILAADDLLAPYGFNPARHPGVFSFLSGVLILFAVSIIAGVEINISEFYIALASLSI